MPVTMQFDAIPNKTYNGKISKIDLAGDVASNAVTFTVTAELTDGDALVKPGMSANVTIIVKKVDNAVLVPNRAILSLNGKHTVQVFKNGQITPVEVQVGVVTDTASEILSGLNAGDTIVITTGGTPAAGGFGGGGGAVVRTGGG
jgi:multidrug efflux pump subunit AcrA (membrane-fusion protein)